LKKRSKKLLQWRARVAPHAHLISKSFLVLFYKKELLSFSDALAPNAQAVHSTPA
jgi:hypothetical protein